MSPPSTRVGRRQLTTFMVLDLIMSLFAAKSVIMIIHTIPTAQIHPNHLSSRSSVVIMGMRENISTSVTVPAHLTALLRAAIRWVKATPLTSTVKMGLVFSPMKAGVTNVMLTDELNAAKTVHILSQELMRMETADTTSQKRMYAMPTPVMVPVVCRQGSAMPN